MTKLLWQYSLLKGARHLSSRRCSHLVRAMDGTNVKADDEKVRHGLNIGTTTVIRFNLRPYSLYN